MAETDPLARLTVDHFVPHIGQPFEVTAQGLTVALSLQSAEPLRLVAPFGRQGFALVYAGESSLPQGIYTVAHPTLGGLDLFLVPIGPGAQGLQYEAIFN